MCAPSYVSKWWCTLFFCQFLLQRKMKSTLVASVSPSLPLYLDWRITSINIQFNIEKFVRIKFNSRLWQGRCHAISAYGPPKFDDLLSNEKHWGPREHDHSLVFGGRRLDTWYLLWPKRIITGKCFIFFSSFLKTKLTWFVLFSTHLLLSAK